MLFYSSYLSLNYFENNPDLKAKFERKKSLISLAKKLENISKFNNSNLKTRQIASISESQNEVDLTVDDSVGANQLAKKYYIVAKAKCYEINKEIECLSTIEAAVTQFPGSSWTAESLVLLTDFYYRTKRSRTFKK